MADGCRFPGPACHLDAMAPQVGSSPSHRGEVRVVPSLRPRSADAAHDADPMAVLASADVAADRLDLLESRSPVVVIALERSDGAQHQEVRPV